jgi:F-type H+-transporting ATPase subunit gamma
MPSLRDVKKKIGSVKNTQQITRAMKMVATAKLRKAMDRLRTTRFYLEKFEQIVADLKPVIGEGHTHPLFQARPVKSIGLVLITGERGLCGSFNQDLLRRAEALLKDSAVPTKKLFLIGKKAHDFFRGKGLEPVYYHPNLANQYDVKEVREAAKVAISCYTQGEIDKLLVIFSGFQSALVRTVRVTELLPLEGLGGTKISRRFSQEKILYDPSPVEILNSLIPRFVEVEFTRAVLESEASEQAARMIAMTSATDRADDLISEMTLTFNRTRQALITKELSEIVGGAAALQE